MTRKFLLAAMVTAPFVLSACGGAPSNGMVNTNRDGAKVTGEAGSDWSEAELRDNAFGVVCGGKDEKVTDLVLTKNPDGSATFTATCVK